MNDIDKSRINEIAALHSEILGNLRQSLTKAIKIGELLSLQKDTLAHGEFTKWISQHLPFTDRTARNYMRLYRERDRLKTETISDLTEAYGILVEHKQKDALMLLEEIKGLLIEAENNDSLQLSEEIQNLISTSKNTICEGIRKITDIKEAIEIHEAAKEVSSLAAIRAIETERKYGEVLNDLTKLGVSESVLSDPNKLSKLREFCEMEIARLQASLTAAENELTERR
jgi:hypothetical protein